MEMTLHLEQKSNKENEQKLSSKRHRRPNNWTARKSESTKIENFPEMQNSPDKFTKYVFEHRFLRVPPANLQR